jgi:methylated-DNA-[protein]-cysteine S-methyltransferase
MMGRMRAEGFFLFDTAIGACALAWNAQAIAGVWLPEATPTLLRERIARRTAAPEGAPPPAVTAAAKRIAGLLEGRHDDLLDVVLDLDAVPDFHRRVYALARAIPPGRTRSYGELAKELGDAGLSRAVGQALGRNPFPIVVPCHRILAAGQGAGGFSAPGGVKTKHRLLEIEGAFGGQLF